MTYLKQLVLVPPSFLGISARINNPKYVVPVAVVLLLEIKLCVG
jgi:hypothetical protein